MDYKYVYSKPNGFSFNNPRRKQTSGIVCGGFGFQDSTLVLTWASKIGIKVHRIYILGCQLNMTPN